MNKYLAAGILGLAAAATAQPVQSWGRYLDVTINTTATGGGANVTDTVSQFPLLLRLNTTNAAAPLAEALTGGADVRLADSAGNAIPFEIEQWSSTGAAVWVRVPRIRGNSNTNKVRLYWGKAGAASASRDSAVFNASNGYAAVFHLNENTGDTARDATGARFKGVPTGTTNPQNVAAASAISGNAKAFGGTAADVADSVLKGGAYRLETRTGGNTFNSFDYTGSNAAFTVSTWVNFGAFPAGFSRRRGILTKADHGLTQLDNNDPNTQWFLRPNTAARIMVFQRVATVGLGTAPYSVGSDAGNGGIAGVLNNWNYVTYIANGTGADDNLLRIYNATARGSKVIPDQEGEHKDIDVFIGGFASNSGVKSTGTHFFNGSIDEVRISNVSRSAGWADLEYETQKPAATAVTYGTAQTNDTSRVFLYPVRTASYFLTQAVSVTPFVKAGTTINVNGYALVSGTLPTGITFSAATGALTGSANALSAPVVLAFSATSGSTVHRDTITLSVVAGDAPGAPAKPTAAYDSGTFATATIAWTAPSNTGSTAIIGYKVIAVQDTAKSCSTTTALTCKVTGLVSTTSYSFQVRAINAAGGGALSTASDLIIPPTTPGAPLQVIAAANGGNGTATVYWVAPTFNGGSAITGYKAYVVGDTAKTCVWTTGILQCQITGITATSATFQVRAINSVGAGPLSNPSPSLVVGLASGSFMVRVSGMKSAFTFRLAESAFEATDRVKMTVTNSAGRTVWSKSMTPSTDGLELSWNGKSANGLKVSAGLYIVKMTLVSNGKELEFADKAISLKP